MSSEITDKMLVIAEKFHVTILPFDPLDCPTWWVVDLLVRAVPALHTSGDDALAEHSIIIRHSDLPIEQP